MPKMNLMRRLSPTKHWKKKLRSGSQVIFLGSGTILLIIGLLIHTTRSLIERGGIQGVPLAFIYIMDRFKMDEPTARLHLTYPYIQAIQEDTKASKVVIFIGVGKDGLPIFLQLPTTPP